MSNCINSSKVYCKCQILKVLLCHLLVLIVAKCIVNMAYNNDFDLNVLVLIVAKCIVNFHILSYIFQ